MAPRPLAPVSGAGAAAPCAGGRPGIILPPYPVLADKAALLPLQQDCGQPIVAVRPLMRAALATLEAHPLFAARRPDPQHRLMRIADQRIEFPLRHGMG